MKKILIYKVTGILALLLNLGGLYDYSFSDKWMFFYDNARLTVFTAAITGVCMLALGFNKKRNRGFFIAGLIASLPLVFFTIVYTINSYKQGFYTLLHVATIIWLLLLISLCRIEIETSQI
ncbi:MAG: hypothetical protein ACOX1F_05990 [Erysipelotrichaceae bacterium]|jgi:peptidoglycan/LPS O-acetylase OafA/YrhL